MTVRRRLVAAIACALLAAPAPLVMSAPAFAGTADGVTGVVESAVQARDGSVLVTGWALRRAHPDRRMWVCVWSANACRKKAYTTVYRRRINERFHIHGNHGFQVRLPRSAVAQWVTVRDWPPGSPILSQRDVSHPGERIVALAKRYVGKSPYRSGGASPSGFDCSGFTMYVYEHAGVATLAHYTESQRHAPYMRRIVYKSQARPGDLVFYLSGGGAYHVAIYAGNGKQYAATVPGERIRYQPIWSGSVEYRTDWH